MTGWIQHANLDSDELGKLTLDAAIQAFLQHPWDREVAHQQELEAQETESCPPGMGLVHPDGLILHLCPLANGSMMAFYHFPARRGWAKWLGQQQTLTMFEGPIGLGVTLMEHFFGSDHEALVQALRQRGAL